MPYKTNAELPKELQKLPNAAQSLFRTSFNRAAARGNSESSSFKIAWSVVKKRFKKVGDKWVARSGAFIDTQYYTFQAKPAEQFVSRTDDGHTIHKYVLTDTLPDNYGTSPSEELLNEWATQIVGKEVDTDHQLYDEVVRVHGGKSDFVKRAMEAKQGIAKIVDAIVENGKLVVSVLFDKRYENHINSIKGLSIEAMTRVDELSNKWIGGELFGASFAVNANPVNPRSKRLVV